MSDEDVAELVTGYLISLHIALLHLELRDVFEAFCRFVDEHGF